MKKVKPAFGQDQDKDSSVAISRRKSRGSKSGRISIARSLSMIGRSEEDCQEKCLPRSRLRYWMASET